MRFRLVSLSMIFLIALVVAMPIAVGGCESIANALLYSWIDDNFGDNSNAEAPVIEQITADHEKIVINENVLLEATASDDNDAQADLKYFWFASAGVLTNPTSRITAWKAPSKAQTVTMTLMVEDTDGNQDTQTVQLVIAAY